MPSGIRANLFLIVFGATLPLVILIVALVWRDARHEADVVRAQALEHAHAIAHELDRIGWQMDTILHTAEQLVASGEEGQAAVASYLRQLQASDERPPLHHISFFDDRGREFLTLDGLGAPIAPVTELVEEVERWQAALDDVRASEEISLAGPFMQGPAGTPVVVVAKRSLQPDAGVSVIAASLPIDHLRELAALPKLPTGSVVTISMSDGTILARSLDHDEWVGRNLSSLASFQEALTVESGTQVAQSVDGAERLAAYTRTRHLSLLAYIGLPTEVAFAPLYSHVTAVVATVGLIVLMVVLVGWWLASRIHRPLRQIEAGVADFAAGNLARRISPQGPRELTRLAEGMNHMAGALQARERDLLASRAALERSEQMLESIIDSEPACVKILDPEMRVVRINAAGREIIAAGQRPLTGVSLADLLLPDDEETFRRHFSKVLAGESDRVEYRISDFDRAQHTLESFAAPIRLPTDEGTETFYLSVSRDVTADRETEERQRQSQRLTSIGKLTGGIAHDFNNLLTVIVGSIEMLQEKLEDRPDVARPLNDALLSAQRGAELTSRLLAFARRQPLRPRRLDLNALVASMTDLLTRTLGEQVQVRTRPAADLWPTVADPSQLESVLLNLALNARDAMPAGGRLTIETANASIDDSMVPDPGEFAIGDYVQLSVTDSGSGMSPEVLSRVFEPFFSTKDPGKGNGLGLSMAHGFAKQSGGQIRIYSEIGRGTTVRLYLPRAEAAAEANAAPTRTPQLPGQGERILLVEDDAAVRELSANSLRMLGYRVAIACDAKEALAALESDQPVDLLFTDVVLPGGMDGAELAERAVAIRPGLKVLFTSGYSESAILKDGRLVAGVQLISKPYRRDELSRRLREALEQPAYQPAGA